MRIGYACLTVGVEDTKFKSCTIKNANETNLLSIIENNLNSLENIIDYNIKNNIKLFRITSDLIPFGSSDINKVPWWSEFSTKFSLIGAKIKSSNMRVSMHPGQYTVLNSPREDVVKKAIDDLSYHTKVLDSLGVGVDSKLVLHIGGAYNDKNKAKERFITNFNMLDKKIKDRLVIENDDKLFNIEDVLEISEKIDIPVVFDNLHDEILKADDKKDSRYWIEKCRQTWKKEDGIQKIHYSQQDLNKRKGSHSKTICVEKFIEFAKGLDENLDIMLEVKDKNLSAIKCINATSKSSNIKDIEEEWSRYKYSVLERDHNNYKKIRNLLKDKEEYPVVEFYKLIDEALEKEETKGNTTNAALHIWGYFKSLATESEKSKFMKYLKGYEENNNSQRRFKKVLWELTKKYEVEYLLNSYYFN